MRYEISAIYGAIMVIHHVVPGAGERLLDDTDWMWPTSGATWTDPLLAATYCLWNDCK